MAGVAPAPSSAGTDADVEPLVDLLAGSRAARA
jgi:hypothetical protein